MATEVLVPVLGESITEATLGEWLKQPGDPVKLDEPIASLETDKVAVDVPSPVDGVMGEQEAAIPGARRQVETAEAALLAGVSPADETVVRRWLVQVATQADAARPSR